MRVANRYPALLKILFSLILLAVLFHEIHIKTLLPYLKNIDIPTLSCAILILFLGNLIAIYRWIVIMRTLGAPEAASLYFKIYLIGTLFNQMLPSSIGGDAYRILEITKLGMTKRLAITSVLTDRMVGFLGLITISLSTLPISYHLLPHHIFFYLCALSGSCLMAMIIMYFLNSIHIPLLELMLRWLYDLSHTLNACFLSYTDFIKKLMLSILTNLSSIMSFYLIALALGIPCHAMDFIIIIPLVTLVMMIPLSMAGWGIREGAMVYFGVIVGLDHSAALAISVVSGLVLIVNSLPGFYFYFAKKEAIAEWVR